MTDEDNVFALTGAINEALHRVDHITEALGVLGMAEPADEIRAMQSRIRQLTDAIRGRVNDDLQEQLKHNQDIFGGLLGVGMKMAAMKDKDPQS